MKTTIYAFIAIVAICSLNFWYQVYIVGLYYENAGLFLTLIGGLIPLAILFAAIKSVIYIKKHKFI